MEVRHKLLIIVWNLSCQERQGKRKGRRERKREGRVSPGTLYSIINSKAEINLCRKYLSFLLG